MLRDSKQLELTGEDAQEFDDLPVTYEDSTAIYEPQRDFIAERADYNSDEIEFTRDVYRFEDGKVVIEVHYDVVSNV